MDHSTENVHVEDGFKNRNLLPSMDAYLPVDAIADSRIRLVAGFWTSYSPEAPAVGAATESLHFQGWGMAVIRCHSGCMLRTASYELSATRPCSTHALCILLQTAFSSMLKIRARESVSMLTMASHFHCYFLHQYHL
jgi:hypothetical protein